MKSKILFNTYKVYEDGDIYNIKSGNKLNPYLSRGSYMITLLRNKKNYTRQMSRFIYETFNEELKRTDRITFKDGDNSNFHLKNLRKFCKDDEIKLDKNKKWKKIPDYPNYKISDYGDIYSISANKIMSLSETGERYLRITLINNGVKKKILYSQISL